MLAASASLPLNADQRNCRTVILILGTHILVRTRFALLSIRVKV